MKRFVDRTFPPASLEGDAAALFCASGPSADAPEAKRRVRERLMAAPVRSRPRFVLAPAIVVVGLAIGTAAGATLGVRWWHETRAATSASPASQAPSPVAAPRPATRQAAAIESSPPVQARQAAPSAPAPGRPAALPPKRIHPAAEDGETTLLFEATRALRRDRDPARAGALLDDYFRRYPRGALAEEALAVAIEAAQAHGDARGRELAHRYLARYPNGHFRKVAERALAGPAE